MRLDSKPREMPRLRITKIELVLFLLGFFSMFYVQFGGQIYITEFAFIVFLPFMMLTRRLRLLPKIKTILILGFIWLAMQIITDFIHQSRTNDALRGEAGIAFLLINILALSTLVGWSIPKLLIFLWGVALGDLLQLFIQPSPYFRMEPWKFGYANPVILFLLLLIVFFAHRRIDWIRHGILPLVSLAFFSLYWNSRVNAGFLLLAAGLIWFRFFAMGRVRRFRIKPATLAFLVFFTLAVVYGSLKVYEYAAVQGVLGESAKAKYMAQYSPQLGVVSVILGGRSEVLGAMQAIADSPFLGHGSWARNQKYRLYMYQMSGWGFTQSSSVDYEFSQQDLIPAHSHIFQAWVWAGPLGALFWIYIFLFILRSIYYIFRLPTALFPLLTFFCIRGLWDILFSPFGSEMRMRWALVIISLLIGAMPVVTRNSQSNRQ